MAKTITQFAVENERLKTALRHIELMAAEQQGMCVVLHRKHQIMLNTGAADEFLTLKKGFTKIVQIAQQAPEAL